MTRLLRTRECHTRAAVLLVLSSLLLIANMVKLFEKKKTKRLGIEGIVSSFLASLLVFYFTGTYLIVRKTRNTKEPPVHRLPPEERNAQERKAHEETDLIRPSSAISYLRYKALALELAGLEPAETLRRLHTMDPFGTRTFEQRLIEEETRLGRILLQSELRDLFPCPAHVDRITLPDFRNPNAAFLFRSSAAGYFIFFQHLRKAGGTQFCELAERNIPRNKLPDYHCMPDYHWNDTIGSAGNLHHYSNKVISDHMLEDGYVIAGNEWDHFDRRNHFNLHAVFVTSFRKPLDRALSQFRFECVEDRGCKTKSIEEYWQHRSDLYNVYTRTFADPDKTFGLKNIYLGDSEESAQKRKGLLSDAMDTIRRFHVVTSLEFIAYSEPIIRSVLGFKDTSTLTKRVRPHIAQFQRKDGQGENTLGAAGVHKASWNPETYLSPKQLKIMSESLALDEILTDVARRIFLERLVCEDY